MILTVTPNALLERRLSYKSINLGCINRGSAESFFAGGKGINVSRQLNKLSRQNSALTFLGGNNGKLLRKILTDEHINFVAVSTKGETRQASVIIEERTKRVTSFFSPNSVPDQKEIKEFIDRLEKAIKNASIVVFSGSTPSINAGEIFLKGIELTNHYDKISIVDTYGSHLKDCLDLSPFCIHNNVSEIEKSLGITLDSERDKTDFLKELYGKRIKLAFLTDGRNPAYASKFDFIYKILPPKINFVDSLGSGDAFVAGIIHGLDKSLVFEESLKLAVSLGSVNAERFDACNISQEDADKFVDNLEVIPIGKKMKIINDSPNH